MSRSGTRVHIAAQMADLRAFTTQRNSILIGKYPPLTITPSPLHTAGGVTHHHTICLKLSNAIRYSKVRVELHIITLFVSN
jgi:hypothetical protein